MRSSAGILISRVLNLSLLVLPHVEQRMSQIWNLLDKEGTLEKDGEEDGDGDEEEEVEVGAGVR